MNYRISEIYIYDNIYIYIYTYIILYYIKYIYIYISCNCHHHPHLNDYRGVDPIFRQTHLDVSEVLEYHIYGLKSFDAFYLQNFES